MESVKFAAPVDNNNNEWKTKKNYGPAALFTVVLLGTAFLAGKSYGRNSNDPTSSVSPITSLSVPVCTWRFARIVIYFCRSVQDWLFCHLVVFPFLFDYIIWRMLLVDYYCLKESPLPQGVPLAQMVVCRAALSSVALTIATGVHRSFGAVPTHCASNYGSKDPCCGQRGAWTWN